MVVVYGLACPRLELSMVENTEVMHPTHNRGSISDVMFAAFLTLSQGVTSSLETTI